MPPAQNPLILLAWIVGVPGGLALLTLLVKGIWFIAKATSKLTDVEEKVDANTSRLEEFIAETRRYRHDKNDEAHEFEVSLAVIEMDVNMLQEKADITVRQYPDRRIGPKDRRVG